MPTLTAPQDTAGLDAPDLPHRAQHVPVYPVFLTGLADMLCVVVGGGTVAARKVRGLLAAGARVRVISPELCAELDALHATQQVEWIPRAYCAGDLAGASLVFAATDARTANQAVAGEARQSGILCNVADSPAEGTFHVPAVYRGSCPSEQEMQDNDAAQVVIAVGTGGQSPGLARRLRDALVAALNDSTARET